MVMKKKTITQVLVIVLKSFKKFFNGSTIISKIQKKPYEESKMYVIKDLKSTLSKNLIKNLKKVLCHKTLP